MIRTRFAPSPTGLLHVGGLRTALYAYLFAKKHGGTFLLRIEDTDQERFVEGGIENILMSLSWAGISPEEGVKLGSNGQVTEQGEHGPYIQSKRLPIYTEYIQKLLAAGQAYYCFCTSERLDEMRKLQELNKQPTGYDGHCRTLAPEVVKENLDNKIPRVVRMKMPKEGSTSFEDGIRGTVSFQNALIDDQVLIKSDGFPTYHFAVVVDDHLMEITHVIRGEEWISSTPKHLMLYQMFGWNAPAFAHLSLIVNEQKQKLSKRHGDVSVTDFQEKGYLPEALVNFIAFLGWNPGTEKELFTLAELEQAFSLEQVSKAAAVFNLEKLNWYNQQYIRALPIERLTELCLPYLLKAEIIKKEQSLDKNYVLWVQKVINLVRDRLATLAEVGEAVAFLFAPSLEYDGSMLVWKKSTKEEASTALEALYEFLDTVSESTWEDTANLNAKIGEWIKENGYSTGSVLWPMRVALSGLEHSPGPFEIACTLGKHRSLERLATAKTKLSAGV